eukprot:6214509-Pleurochrysis_carterae.AAC.4
MPQRKAKRRGQELHAQRDRVHKATRSYGHARLDRCVRLCPEHVEHRRLDQLAAHSHVPAVLDLVGVGPRPAALVVRVAVHRPQLPLAQPVALAPRELGRVAELERGVHRHRFEAHSLLQALREVGVARGEVRVGEGGEGDDGVCAAATVAGALELLEDDVAQRAASRAAALAASGACIILAAAARSRASLAFGEAESVRARCSTSLKNVWSFVHHCTKFDESLDTFSISCARQAAGNQIRRLQRPEKLQSRTVRHEVRGRLGARSRVKPGANVVCDAIGKTPRSRTDCEHASSATRFVRRRHKAASTARRMRNSTHRRAYFVASLGGLRL